VLRMGAHPASPLVVTAAEVAALRSIVRAGSSEQRAVRRARIVLLAAVGVANTRIAKEVGVSLPTVLLWRSRFEEHGLDGLADAPHPGRPRLYGREVRDKIVTETLTPPEGSVTNWSRARLAARVGVSASTVGRVWREANLKPHRTETFTYSTDPLLVEKVTDVVGLYLNPPERAIVLSVFDATQVQALDRTQPMLPLRPGLPERQRHEDKRNGSISLFAALEIATGRVTHDTRKRYTGAGFLAFLKRIARAYPKGEIHLILDNVSTHKTPAVRAWLEQHPRFQFHFTPTSASWMNQIETWFGILTRQAIRRGSFNGVRALIDVIDDFTSQWNDHVEPFVWVKTADDVFAKAIHKTKENHDARH